jgi:Holliday junction resolvase RusA-like endonuclease
MITCELPYAPSVNHYYQRVGRRVFLSQKGREFREQVQVILQSLAVKPLDGPLGVFVDLYPPDRRKRDCDNVIKALLDALQHGGAYADDCQIVRLVVTKHPPVPAGKTIVQIDQYPEG